MITGAVEDKHGMGAGSDCEADLFEVRVHRFGVCTRQHQAGGASPLRTNSAEQIGPFRIADRVAPRAGAANSRPFARQAALLVEADVVIGIVVDAGAWVDIALAQAENGRREAGGCSSRPAPRQWPSRCRPHGPGLIHAFENAVRKAFVAKRPAEFPIGIGWILTEPARNVPSIIIYRICRHPPLPEIAFRDFDPPSRGEWQKRGVAKICARPALPLNGFGRIASCARGLFGFPTPAVLRRSRALDEETA